MKYLIEIADQDHEFWPVGIYEGDDEEEAYADFLMESGESRGEWRATPA